MRHFPINKPFIVLCILALVCLSFSSTSHIHINNTAYDVISCDDCLPATDSLAQPLQDNPEQFIAPTTEETALQPAVFSYLKFNHYQPRAPPINS